MPIKIFLEKTLARQINLVAVSLSRADDAPWAEAKRVRN